MALAFLTNSLYLVFLTTLFSTASPSLLMSAGVISNLPTPNLFILLLKLFKSFGTFLIHQYLIY